MSYAFLLPRQSKVEVRPCRQGATITLGTRSVARERLMFEAFVGVLIGFGCGYGVRDQLSHEGRCSGQY